MKYHLKMERVVKDMRRIASCNSKATRKRGRSDCAPVSLGLCIADGYTATACS